MGRSSVSAFLSRGRNGLCTRPGSAAVMPRARPSPPTFWIPISTTLHSHGDDESLDPTILPHFRTPKSGSHDRTSNATRPERPAAKKSVMALLWAVTVFFGSPNFEGTDIPVHATMNYKASALESISSNDSMQSFSTSTLSNKLFESMSAREITKDPASPPRNRQRYWDSMKGTKDDITFANEKLIDRAVATISTMYYDTSGGFNFDAHDFYAKWKKFRYSTLNPHNDARNDREQINMDEFGSLAKNGFSTRENAVKTLKSIVSQLNDPYSKYLTREELIGELEGGDDGFLGLGALVDAPKPSSSTLVFDPNQSVTPLSSSPKKEFNRISNRPVQGGVSLESPISPNEKFTIPMSKTPSVYVSRSIGKTNPKKGILSVAQAANLPVITAIIPDSPAERAGLVVGDRIASVGDYQLTGMRRSGVQKALRQKFHASNYFGRADLTIAKQVLTSSPLALNNKDARYDVDGNIIEEKYVFEDGWYRPKSRQRTFDSRMQSEQLLGYKLSHVKSIPTTLTAKLDSSATLTKTPSSDMILSKYPSVVGGDSIVHFELLTPDDSIFQHMSKSGESQPVGYIRLTRFSRSSSTGYINAINSLEEAGAQSYIIDIRNNYGGVIQEAMLTASTLLRDPHDVLCYTLNSRGGFKPQENMEYIVDSVYPGYLLSSESTNASRDQVRREHPEYLEDGGWSSPTSYASLKELRMTRGIKPAHSASSSIGPVRGQGLERQTAFLDKNEIDLQNLANVMTWNSQKKLVILINEGTASAAEVFASALHDNGRTVALVGSNTFGKGLIQHTFPMPDGGGLRLTVAEYLTPSLQHVTKVGGAKYDSGVKPDVRCESREIPQNAGADLCVGVALDVLESVGD